MHDKKNIDGVLWVDKPQGLTSNQLLQKVRRLYSAAKAGHTGTLDPLASGLLVICLGQATKFAQYSLAADKHYEVTAQLGVETTTGDSEGEIIAQQACSKLTSSEVAKLLSSFLGLQMQQPPLYSAIKYQGKPLYQWAREGKNPPRSPREITIYAIEALHYDAAKQQLAFHVHCSKGTYIRSLVVAMGQRLESCAHLIALRRLQVGDLTMARMQGLVELEAMTMAERMQQLAPIDTLLKKFPALQLPEHLIQAFCHGNAVVVAGLPQAKGLMRVYANQQSLLGLAEVMPDGRLQPKRLVV